MNTSAYKFEEINLDTLIKIKEATNSGRSNLTAMYIHENKLRPRKDKLSQGYGKQSSREIPVYNITEGRQRFVGGFFEKSNIEKAPNAKINKRSKKNVMCKQFIQHVDNYCEKSSLHGLKYIGDTTLTIGERIFWIMSCLLALGFAIFFIASLYEKFNKNPVIISFSPTAISLNAIPFPAITICNANIAIKEKAESILRSGKTVQQRLLADYCNSNNSFDNETDTDEQTADWRTVRSFIIDISQRCDDMIKLCTWEFQRFDCSFHINAVLTDEGFCCSFNRLPSNYSLRNAKMMNGLNETYQHDIVDWNIETGYPENSPLKSLPRRVSGSGAHLGLSMILDARIQDYYCSSTNSIGFKITFSNPIEMPKVQDYGFFVTPGYETRIIIKPNIKDTLKSVQGIHVDKRQCFFAQERYLQFYRVYTEKNCQLECQTNHTLRKCGCIPYYLPLNLTSRICGKVLESCVDEAKYEVETGKPGTDCNCLAGCFELSYGKSLSLAKLNVNTVKPALLQNNTLDYFVENMAILHFFFEQNMFVKQTKSELYGFSEFLSNTGGLLGLFLGFSFLSAIELGYYIFVRVSCNILKKDNDKKKDEESDKGIVFPYLS